jgi:hypothetical protein
VEAVIDPFYSDRVFATAEDRQKCAKWDSWRWPDIDYAFRVRQGANDGMLFRVNDKNLLSPYAVGGIKCALDLQYDLELAAEKAGAKWDYWKSVSQRHPPAKSIFWFADLGVDDPRRQPNPRTAYRAQPAIQEWSESVARPGSPAAVQPDPVVLFGENRELFVRSRENEVAGVYGLVSTDGLWHSDTDFTRDERYDLAAFAEFSRSYIDALPDDVFLVKIMYHI